jgi:hypothetical protein
MSIWTDVLAGWNARRLKICAPPLGGRHRRLDDDVDLDRRR